MGDIDAVDHAFAQRTGSTVSCVIWIMQELAEMTWTHLVTMVVLAERFGVPHYTGV
jgi:hypothetical protein